MKLKKFVAVGMACLMSLSMVACGSTGSTTGTTSKAAQSTTASSNAAASSVAATAKGVKSANTDPANTKTSDETLRIALASEPSTLWPSGAGKTENEAQIVSSALMDTLVSKDYKTGKVIPNLATKWEWVDGTHCKFTLRDDVTMSDGKKLVANDVVYDVNKIWIGLNASNDTGRYLKGATADDDHTVTIEFNVNAPDLLEMLTWTNFSIVSEADVNAAGGVTQAQKAPNIGSGKYKFKEWKAGQSITLERNDNYWNKDYKGYYKTIVFTFTNDAAARGMAVQSGDADVAYDMPVSQAGTYATNDTVQTVIYDFGQVAHLWYNMTDKHTTSNQKVRQAIDLALDYDALAAGYGKPALGYFTQDSKYYNATDTSAERATNVEKAKSLLKEAGYAGGLEITTVGMQDSAPIYTVMQENLRAVGITLKINTVDTAQFVQDAFGGNYDIIMVGEYTAARYPTLFCFLDQKTIASGFVIGGPKKTTPEISSAIAAIIQERDETKAKQEIGALEKTLKASTIVTNLYPEMKASILNKDLKGFTTRERGFIDPTNFYK